MALVPGVRRPAQRKKGDPSDWALLTLKRKLAGRVPAPDLLRGTEGVILDEDHLVDMEIVELNGADEMLIQILDADIDAVVAKAKLTRFQDVL
jgi:hypothetical protein